MLWKSALKHENYVYFDVISARSIMGKQLIGPFIRAKISRGLNKPRLK